MIPLCLPCFACDRKRNNPCLTCVDVFFFLEILDAVHRRNFRVTNEVLQKVHKYRYKGALLFEIRKLFKIRKQLILLNSFRKYVPSLRDAAKELIQMPHPPPEVHITIAALFLLLDEPEKSLEVSF